MKIVMIGTGNVATVLGRKLHLAGNEILQVYGRTTNNAQSLASELSAAACTSLMSIDKDGDLYIIAVADKALNEIREQMDLGDRLVVHTAGSVSIDVLNSVSSNYGVLYPLQSLRKELDPLTEVPLLIDANTDANKNILIDFAKTIATKVDVANDDKRMKLHVAAVMVNNFSNHFYALADKYCTQEALDFSLLYPLILETAQRIQHFAPALVQTGPAARRDMVTIDRHLQLLEPHPSLKKLYITLTESILENQ